jgi:hypothetical protein
MAILRQLWTDEKVEGDTRTAYQYVTELRHQIETVCQLAQENIAVAQGKQERLYNKKAAARSYQPGDWVLLLLPTQHNKLQLEWQGPYKVLGEKGGHTYKVLVKGKTKVFHANLLKRYVNREEPVVVATVVYEDVDTPETSTNSLPSCPLESKETYKQVEIGKELSAEQQTQMEDLLHRYRDIWIDVPGRTNLAKFEVNQTSGATTDDGTMHTSGHASCIGMKVVGVGDGDHPTSKRASNQVACATTDPWNRVVGGAELGEQLCQGDAQDGEGSHPFNNRAATSKLEPAKVGSSVHGCGCSCQENVLKDLIGRISEFLNVAADLIRRLVPVPPKNQLDVDGSHIASGFGLEHRYHLVVNHD